MLSNDKILNLSKLKVFSDDKFNVVETGENVGYQHFLLFPQCLQKPVFSELLKVGVVWYKINPFTK